VKKGLKSVYIYRSYYKNKLGGPFFMEHPVNMTTSRLWPFWVTWRHEWRHHSIRHRPFPIIMYQVSISNCFRDICI